MCYLSAVGMFLADTTKMTLWKMHGFFFPPSSGVTDWIEETMVQSHVLWRARRAAWRRWAWAGPKGGEVRQVESGELGDNQAKR